LYLEGKLGKKQQAQWMQIAKLAIRGAGPRAWGMLQRGARNATEFVYSLYALAVCAVVVPVLWLLIATTHDRERAVRMIHAAARTLLRCALIRMRVEGQELLDKLAESGPWIFAPNHSSYLDIVVALAVLPAGVRFVVKAEAVHMPLFGLMIKRSGQHLFDRNDPAARVRQADEVEAALERGESVVVYPEGTFTPLTGIRPFQLGAFRAAVDTQRPICPVAVRGARQILRDKTYLPKFGRVTVTFGPLVQPRAVGKGEWQEMVRMRDEVRGIVARNVGETML